MRVIILTILLQLSASVTKAQSAYTEADVKILTDSLRNVILKDTVLFNSGVNYSTLFIVQQTKHRKTGQYIYRMQIPSPLVKEFAESILLSDKISAITFITEKSATAIFGIDGVNGAYIIRIKENVSPDFKIAGLTVSKKGLGDNLSIQKNYQKTGRPL